MFVKSHLKKLLFFWKSFFTCFLLYITNFDISFMDAQIISYSFDVCNYIFNYSHLTRKARMDQRIRSMVYNRLTKQIITYRQHDCQSAQDMLAWVKLGPTPCSAKEEEEDSHQSTCMALPSLSCTIPWKATSIHFLRISIDFLTHLITRQGKVSDDTTILLELSSLMILILPPTVTGCLRST